MTNADLNFANVFLNKKKRLKNKKTLKNVIKIKKRKKRFTSLLHPFAVHLYCSIPPVTFE